MAWLSVEYVSLDDRRRTLFQKPVEDFNIVFGALPDCDVCIDEEMQPRVALRDHCTIDRPGDFRLVYKARNPVWLDGKLVASTTILFPEDKLEHWIWLGAMPPRDPPNVKFRDTIDPEAVGLAGRGHFRCVLDNDTPSVPPPERQSKIAGQIGERRILTAQGGTNKLVVGAGLGLAALIAAGGFAAGLYLPGQFDTLRANQDRARLRDAEIKQMLEPILETTAFQEKARQSIYVVGARTGNTFTPKGTAWVAELGGHPRLISNWHVGSQLKAAADNGQELIARITLPSGKVEDIPLQPDYVGHPSYLDYQVVLESVRASGNWPNIFDAAELPLVREEDRSKLGAPLPIAQDMFELRQLQEVGYIGFPVEGLSATRFNPAAPVATPVVGKIQNVTDGFQRQLTPVEHRALLQTNLEAAGGASGSPLFDARGRVVGMVSGGDTTMVLGPDGVPVRVPTGNFYAVRADIIEELGGRPAPVDRRSFWLCAVRQFDGNGGGACSAELAAALAPTQKLDASGAFKATIALEAGRHTIRAHANSPTLLRLKASWGDGKSTESDTTALQGNEPELTLRLAAPGNVTIELSGAPSDEFSWSHEAIATGSEQ